MEDHECVPGKVKKSKEFKFDPQRDNCGLYALKCDRNAAKRGLVLNISSSVQRRLSPDLKKNEICTPCEMNHEKYEPVVRREFSFEDGHERHIQAPPRRKRKSTLGSQDTLHSIPAVPVDEEVIPFRRETKEDPINTNVKDMCRHFERQASVDIFTQTKTFEDFDNIFGPSPVPPPSALSDDNNVSTESRQTVRRRFVGKFSSSSDSFDSEEIAYFKRRTKTFNKDPKVKITKEVAEKTKKDDVKQVPSKVDKIVFKDKFEPNSFEPPLPYPGQPSEEITTTNTRIDDVDFEKAFKAQSPLPEIAKEVVKSDKSEELPSLEDNDDEEIQLPLDTRKAYNHDQLTISRHYLNQDIEVWTF